MNMFRKIPTRFIFALLLGSLSQTGKLPAQIQEPTAQQLKIAEAAYHQQEEHHFTYNESKQFLKTFHRPSREKFAQGIKLIRAGQQKEGEKLIYEIYTFLASRNAEHFEELQKYEIAAAKHDPDNTFFNNVCLKAQTIQINLNAQRSMLVLIAHDVNNEENFEKICYALLAQQEKAYHKYTR